MAPRRARSRALVAIVAALLAAVAVVAALPTIAGRIAAWRLAAAGFGPVHLEVAEIGFGRAVVRDLRLAGGDLTIDRLEVDYTVGELLDGRLQRIAASGVEAAGGLPATLPTGDGAGTGWQIGLLELRQANVVVDTAAGPLLLAVDGALREVPEAPAGTVDLAVTGRAVAAVARLEMTPETAHLTIADGMLNLPEAALSGLRGHFTAATGHPLDSLTGSASAATARFSDVVLTAPRLDVGGDDVLQATVQATLPALGAVTAGLTVFDWRWSDGGGGGDVTVSLAAAGGLAEQATARVHGRIAWSGDQLTVRETQPAELTAVALRLPGGVVLPDRLRAESRPTEAPLLHLERGPAGWQVRNGAVALAAAPFVVEAGLPLSVGGLETEFAYDAAAPATATVRVDKLLAGTAPPWLVPLGITGTASLSPAIDTLRVTAAAADPAKRLQLDVSAEHRLADGAGTARIRLAPLTFAPGALQPAAVVPALGGVLAQVAGTVALSGTVAWTAAGHQSDLELLLQGIGFTAGPVRVVDLNSVVTIDHLWPLTTPPRQEVAVALVELGLPLTDGLVRFAVEPSGDMPLRLERLNLAGGTVAAGEIAARPFESRLATTLTVADVELQRLLSLAGLEGATATGRLAGSLPVAVTPDGVAIRGGRLAAAEPGRIRYRPDQVPAALQSGGEGVSLMLAALEDFRYERLWLTVDREVNGDMEVGLHVRGANPALYEGHPVELNIRLSGALDRVIRQSLEGYRIPADISERIQRFGRGP